jgi:hypothetical protein
MDVAVLPNPLTSPRSKPPPSQDRLLSRKIAIIYGGGLSLAQRGEEDGKAGEECAITRGSAARELHRSQDDGLWRKSAFERGKEEGAFCILADIGRNNEKTVGIGETRTGNACSVYDPACICWA